MIRDPLAELVLVLIEMSNFILSKLKVPRFRVECIQVVKIDRKVLEIRWRLEHRNEIFYNLECLFDTGPRTDQSKFFQGKDHAQTLTIEC